MADPDSGVSSQPRIEPIRGPGPNRRLHPCDTDPREAACPISTGPDDVGFAITSVVSLADTDIPELHSANIDNDSSETQIMEQTPLVACEVEVTEPTSLNACEIDVTKQTLLNKCETTETANANEDVDDFKLSVAKDFNGVKLKPNVLDDTDRREVSGVQRLNKDVGVEEKRKMDNEGEKRLTEASDHVRLLGMRIVDVRSVPEDRNSCGKEVSNQCKASEQDLQAVMVTNEVQIVNDELPEVKVSRADSPLSEVAFPKGNATSDNGESILDNTRCSERELPIVTASYSENEKGLLNARPINCGTDLSGKITDCTDTRVPNIESIDTEVELSIVTASCTEPELSSVNASCFESIQPIASCSGKESTNVRTADSETSLPNASYSEYMLPEVIVNSKTGLSNVNEGSIELGLSSATASSIVDADHFNEGNTHLEQETADEELAKKNLEIAKIYRNETSTDINNGKETDFGEESLMIVDVRSLSEENSNSPGVSQIPNASIETDENKETEEVNMETVLDPVSREISKEQVETEDVNMENVLNPDNRETSKGQAGERNEASDIQKLTKTESLSLDSEGAKVRATLSPAEEESTEIINDELRMTGPAILSSSSASSSNSSSTSSFVSSTNSSKAPTTLTSSSMNSSLPSFSLLLTYTTAAEVAKPIVAASIVSTTASNGYTTVQLTNKDTQKLASSEQNTESANKNQSITSKSNENSTTGLPVIEHVFSVKTEPADDGSYGLMPGSSKQQTTAASLAPNRASISTVINKLHHGKTVPTTVQIPVSTLNAKGIKLFPVCPGNKQVVTQVGRQQGVAGQVSSIGGLKQSAGPGTPSPIRYIYATTTINPSQPNTAPLNKSASQTSDAQKMVLTNGQVKLVPSSTKPSTLPPQGHSMKVCYQYNPTTNKTGEIKQKPILPREVIVQNAKTIAVVPSAATIIAAPGVTTATSKYVAPKVVKERLKEKQYINIQTVGVEKITELIARKNPIPTYKPPPLPDKLKNSVARKTYPCYECGDTFYFENSLNIHLTRCSMRLQYNCTRCQAQLQFTNKCQLLNHLRSHLNIDKTQAVPIHIKSDSIQIKTVYDEIGGNKNFEWYNEKKVRFGSNYDTCVVCNTRFTSDEADQETIQRSLPIIRAQHFEMCRGNVPYKCDICYRHMTNACSLALHKKLHTILKDGKISEDMICPECGLNFGHGDAERFYLHLMTQCFHVNRMWVWGCKRCETHCGNKEEMRQHLLTQLDNYYKCTMCPMALKSLGSFKLHYRQKHKASKEDIINHVKMIYRCHFCDTLIDDRQFLLSHLDKHLAAYIEKGHFVLKCSQCKVLVTKNDRVKHHLVSAHPQYVCDITKCNFCGKKFENILKLLNHELIAHKIEICSERATFCDCGLVCKSKNMLNQHACLLECSSADGSDAPIDVDLGESKDDLKKETNPVESKVGKQLYTPYKCPLCVKFLYSDASKTNHIAMHRGRGEFVCVNCLRKNFLSYHELRSHEILCIAKSKMPPPTENVNGKTKTVSAKSKTESKAGSDETAPRGAVSSKPGLLSQTPKTVSKSSDSESDTESEKNFGKVRLSLKGVAQEKWFTDKGETFQCEKCDKKFSRKSKLEEHISAEHSLHNCHLCGLMYNSLNHLKTHLLKSHKGKKPMYYCWICRGRKIEKCYNEKAFLEKHLTSKHKLKLVDNSRLVPEWPEDDLKGSTPEPQVHTLKVSEEGPPVKRLKMEGESVFRCAKCAFTAEKQEEFREHIAQHGSADSVQCLECGLCFSVLPSLQRHLFMVHKIRNFKAYIKDNAIEEPKELDSLDLIEREPEVSRDETESESEEEETGKELECKVCYKEFESEHNLKQHMRVHGMAFIRKSRRRSAVKKALKTKKADRDMDSSSGSVSVDDGEEPKAKKARTISGSDAEHTEAKKATTASGSDTEHSVAKKARTVSGSDTEHMVPGTESKADNGKPEATKVRTLSGSDKEGSEIEGPRESLKLKISLGGMKATVS